MKAPTYIQRTSLRRRRGLPLAILTALVAMVAAIVLGSGVALSQTAPTGTLDANNPVTQEQWTGGSIVGLGVREAQTFTAGKSGLLTSAQLHLVRVADPYDYPVTVQVTDLDTSGAPGQVLSTATIPTSEIPLDEAYANEPVTTVNFSNPAQVVAGDKYALVADSAQLFYPGYLWIGSGASDYYPSGGLWFDIYNQDGSWCEGGTYCTNTEGWRADDPTYDLGFATYVFSYGFSGFFTPIDNYPTLNVVPEPAGTANQLLRFSLGSDEGLDIFANGYPSSTRVACPTEAPENVVEDTAPAEPSNLRYTGNGQYTYSWQTEKAWKGTCRELNVKLADGTDHKALFQFAR